MVQSADLYLVGASSFFPLWTHCGGSTYSSFRIFFHPRMNRVSRSTIMLVTFFLLCLTLANADVNPNLIYSKVLRKIDISSQTAKVSTTITLENAGDKATGYFLYAMDPALADKVAFISATVSCLWFNISFILLYHNISVFLFCFSIVFRFIQSNTTSSMKISILF